MKKVLLLLSLLCMPLIVSAALTDTQEIRFIGNQNKSLGFSWGFLSDITNATFKVNSILNGSYEDLNIRSSAYEWSSLETSWSSSSPYSLKLRCTHDESRSYRLINFSKYSTFTAEVNITTCTTAFEFCNNSNGHGYDTANCESVFWTNDTVGLHSVSEDISGITGQQEFAIWLSGHCTVYVDDIKFIGATENLTLNFDNNSQYVNNFWLEVGTPDGSYEFNFSGNLTSVQTSSNLSTAFNNNRNSCVGGFGTEDYCANITVHSDVTSILELNFSYTRSVGNIAGSPGGGIPEMDEVFDIIKSGASISTALYSWNPTVYDDMIESFYKLFRTSTLDETLTNFGSLVSLFVKYIFRQPATLANVPSD